MMIVMNMLFFVFVFMFMFSDCMCVDIVFVIVCLMNGFMKWYFLCVKNVNFLYCWIICIVFVGMYVK